MASKPVQNYGIRMSMNRNSSPVPQSPNAPLRGRDEIEDYLRSSTVSSSAIDFVVTPGGQLDEENNPAPSSVSGRVNCTSALFRGLESTTQHQGGWLSHIARRTGAAALNYLLWNKPDHSVSEHEPLGTGLGGVLERGGDVDNESPVANELFGWDDTASQGAVSLPGDWDVDSLSHEDAAMFASEFELGDENAALFHKRERKRRFNLMALANGISKGIDENLNESPKQCLIRSMARYIYVPDDSNFNNFVSAASKVNLITADILVAACGDPAFVRELVHNETLDIEDPVFRIELSKLVNHVIVPDEENLGYRVQPSTVALLQDLFDVPFVRITTAQYKLLMQSGFEFVKLLVEHSHVVEDVLKERKVRWNWIIVTNLRVLYPLYPLFAMCSILVESCGMLLMCYHWVREGNMWYAQLTPISYIVAFIFHCIGGFVIRKWKCPDVYYMDSGNQFPSFHLNLAPLLPLTQFYCFTSLLRLSKANWRYDLALYHDTWAYSVMLHFLQAHTVSISQFMIQSYRYLWIKNYATFTRAGIFTLPYSNAGQFGYLFITIGFLCSVFIAEATYVFVISAYTSVNGVGFALFGSDISPYSRPISSMKLYIQAGVIILLFFLNFNVYTMVFEVINFRNCGTEKIVWTSVQCFALLIGVSFFLLTFWRHKNVFTAAAFCTIPLAVQLAFIIYILVYKERFHPDDKNENICDVLYSITGAVLVASYIWWILLLIVGVAWVTDIILNCLYGTNIEKVSPKKWQSSLPLLSKKQQSVIDFIFNQERMRFMRLHIPEAEQDHSDTGLNAENLYRN